MNTLSERLAELSGKATPGSWSHYTEREQAGFCMVRTYLQAYDGDHLASRIEPENAALIVELVNAYRAGRLIVKD